LECIIIQHGRTKFGKSGIHSTGSNFAIGNFCKTNQHHDDVDNFAALFWPTDIGMKEHSLKGLK
jgi:hypothetical protein